MNTIAVMQPYLFPYLGYFHLMHAVDRFIILDDVAWINGGWINRNRITAAGRIHTVTLPVHGASQNRQINDLERADDGRWRTKFLRTLRDEYGNAPHYARTSEFVGSLLESSERHLSTWLVRSLQLTSMLLGLDVDIQSTSAGYDNGGLKRTERILDICRREGALTYVNLSGGQTLYRPEDFSAYSIRLAFTKSRFESYPQRSSAFIAGLSIIDVLMYCNTDEIAAQLESYDLIYPL